MKAPAVWNITLGTGKRLGHPLARGREALEDVVLDMDQLIDAMIERVAARSFPEEKALTKLSPARRHGMDMYIKCT